MIPSPDIPATPRWLHWWAVLTVCATICLLTVGAKVTTIKAGMAERQWPTHILHLFFSSRDDAASVIEHSHRFAGYLVGICTIVLAAGLWIAERRRWLCWLGTLALACVSLQGVLGGMRVLHDEELGNRLGPILAAAHGCFAQLVFALLVSLVLFTSRWWGDASTGNHKAAESLRGVCLLGCVALYGQIVFGAILRQPIGDLVLKVAQRLHLLGAFLAVVCLVWLIGAVRRQSSDFRLRRLVGLLAILLVVQLGLGVEAWLNRFGPEVKDQLYGPPVTITSGMTRTLHFVVGSLLFATNLVLTILVRQPSLQRSEEAMPRHERVLEGVA